MMYDRDIRALLVAGLEAGGVRVVHEWAVGGCVVDVAAVTPDGLHAYEIKGPRDSLARLPRQVEQYGRVFDTVTLVGGAYHVRRALDKGLVPAWWGLVQVLEHDALGVASPPRLERVRPATPNPAASPQAVAWLLYNRELRAILQRRCLPYRSTGRPGVSGAHAKPTMVRTLIESVTLEDFRADVCRMLLARVYWKADEGRRTTGYDTRPVGPIA